MNVEAVREEDVKLSGRRDYDVKVKLAGGFLDQGWNLCFDFGLNGTILVAGIVPFAFFETMCFTKVDLAPKKKKKMLAC